MIIEKLKLLNFRNIENLDLDFSKGINYIYGENGQGKTNLVEAIYYLSIARSFRIKNDEYLIQKDKNEFLIKANVTSDAFKNKLAIHYDEKGKHITLNDKNIKKISELSNVINCIYFVPSDVNIFKGDPKIRRNFLNLIISKNSNQYLKLYTEYERLLKNRNEELKKENVNHDLIEIYTNQIIRISKEIYKFRKEYLEKLNINLKETFNSITGKDNIKIIYKSFVNSYDDYEKEALKLYKDALNYDLEHQITSIGIHKEDFLVMLNGKNIALYGSQGENRIASIALKLSPYKLENSFNLKPIVILDDVLSELDKKHEENLLNYLKTMEQVFITSTKKRTIENSTYYLVKEGSITKEGNV